MGEIGLEREIRWNETRTGVFDGERVHSVSNTLELLRFPSLNPLDIARLGMTVLYASRVRDWRRLEQIPVADWLRRWSGRRTFEKFWLPLLRSKLGAAYQDTSAAFIWATIQRLYAARRGGMKKEMFGYVPGGYARVTAAFGDLLKREGVRIELGCAVKRVAPAAGGGIVVDTVDRGTQRFGAHLRRAGRRRARAPRRCALPRCRLRVRAAEEPAARLLRHQLARRRRAVHGRHRDVRARRSRAVRRQRARLHPEIPRA
jgi:phytoene dehydrogenase-like protein